MYTSFLHIYGTGTWFRRKGIELQAEMPAAQFFLSFHILIWLEKTILLYLPAERGFKKLKEPRVLDIIECFIKGQQV